MSPSETSPRGDRLNSDILSAIRAALEAAPDGVLEEVAARCGSSLQAVLDCLPYGASRSASGALFADIWNALVNWGPVVFIVHTKDGVFETKADLPPGSFARGYFNIHGDSPLGGHLRADRCASIYFVDRPFFKRRSCSIYFINTDGEAMFKVFVARDERRELRADQLGHFEALRTAHSASISE